MPGASEILAGLSRTANEWVVGAMAWHVVLGCALFAVVARGWRPSARAVAIATAAPLASVSVFAWLAHNPFNGVVLGAGAAAVVGIAMRVPRGPVRGGPRWAMTAGALSIAFGWLYPHFLEARSWWLYLVASPLGLVPCPSLAVALGIGLCAGAFGSRVWAIAVGVLGLFYGAFGALRLGVWLDLPLIAGALATLALAAGRPPPPASRR